MKRTIAAIMLTITILGVAGCSSQKSKDLEKQVSDLQSQITTMQQNLDTLSKENKSLKDKVKKMEADEVSKATQKQTTNPLFNIYWVDMDTEKILVDSYLPIRSKDVQTQLQEIGDYLSQRFFDGLPIEVTIKEIDSKQIAVINLKEDSSKKQTWKTGHFQGSLGGEQTSECLVQSFLQPEYKGDWIQGVEFTYEGDKIDFDHVPLLSEIQYRK